MLEALTAGEVRLRLLGRGDRELSKFVVIVTALVDWERRAAEVGEDATCSVVVDETEIMVVRVVVAVVIMAEGSGVGEQAACRANIGAGEGRVCLSRLASRLRSGSFSLSMRERK